MYIVSTELTPEKIDRNDDAGSTELVHHLNKEKFQKRLCVWANSA